MGKKRRILLATLAVAVVGGLVWVVMPSGPPEPVYDGKPVSWWLKHPEQMRTEVIIRNSNPDLIVSYPKMNSNAVPFLVKGLERRDGALRRAYINVWVNMPLWQQHHVQEPVEGWLVRIRAAALLAQIGSDAAPSIPALVRVLSGDEDTYVRRIAANALAHIGKSDKRVTEALVEALKDNEPGVARAAGIALKQLDPEAAAKVGVK